MTDLRETVRTRYADAALTVLEGDSCCSTDCCSPEPAANDSWGAALYGSDTEGVPDDALEASLGCGNPFAVADLVAGETVLDLGSGGGIDVFIAARRVGPTGKVYGLDMTDEMLALARRNQAEAGVENVEFIKGYIEDIPLPEGSVDAVISNCVINLSVDKQKVFDEMARVLRPGGHIGITDVVAEDHLSPAERAARGSHVGCIAGALSYDEYRTGLETAGFASISITPTHDVADEMQSAIIKAVLG